VRSMRTRLAIVIGALTLMLALIGSASAGAATQIGSNCAGANSAVDDTFAVQLAQTSANSMPITAPSAGVITSWSSNSALPASVVDRLKVLRAASAPKSFTVVGESAYQHIAPGQNSFPVRIPVQAGDRLGLYGAVDGGGIVYCGTGDAGDRLGYVEKDLSSETTAEFSELGSAVVAVSAVIEPDRDGDGYGDETQDGCPQSAANHGPCPTITINTFPIVLKRSVLLLVSASEASSVEVFGQVGWRPRHKGGALVSKTTKPGDHISKGVIVGLSGGATMVRPGEVTPVNVKLPKSVLRHLSQMLPKQVVKGTITAQTTDLAGRVTQHTIAIRLHGRGPAHSAGAS
jgi:hypothetical protein